MRGWLARLLGRSEEQREAPSITSHEAILAIPWEFARPITVAQHLAAKERIEAASQKFIMIDLGRGPERLYTGFIHMDDYTHRDGYAVRLEGFDRFGWPDGHAMSPARLHE